jgi:DNA-binding transcriptional ArsR family regulator
VLGALADVLAEGKYVAAERFLSVVERVRIAAETAGSRDDRRVGHDRESPRHALTGICLRAHIRGMVETFAALADPNRYRIVELLRGGPRAVNDIGERLHLNQPQVSKHLRVLKEAGLVHVQPRAQQRLYELRPQPLRRLHGWLERYRRVWEQRFEELDALVEVLEEKEKSDDRHRRT